MAAGDKSDIEIWIGKWLLGISSTILVTIIISFPASIWFVARMTTSMEAMSSDIKRIDARMGKLLNETITDLDSRVIRLETLPMLPGAKENFKNISGKIDGIKDRLRLLERKE